MSQNNDSQLFLASDHAGFELKGMLVSYLEQQGYPVKDEGPFTDSSVDYPDFADLLATKMLHSPLQRGILICGSGIGMSIAVNRHRHIRGALCYTLDMARLAREHNDANVLVLGSRFIDYKTTLSIINVFLKTNFEGGRHQARLDKMS